MIIVKSNVDLIVPDGAMQGNGPLRTKLCKSACCKNAPRHERFRLLPCGCHGLQVHCTCKLHDKHCRRCGRVFVTCCGDWYEIEDPHPKAPPRDLSGGRVVSGSPSHRNAEVRRIVAEFDAVRAAVKP